MHICFMSFTKNYCISPSLSAGVDNFQSQILKRREVKCMPGGHKEFLPQIFAWGAYYVPCQKDFVK